MNFKILSKSTVFILFSFFLYSLIFIKADAGLLDSDSVNETSFDSKTTTPEEFYLNGIYNYTKRYYQTAAENFEQLTKNFPYSKYTRNSLILEAYTSYINKDFEKIEGIFAIYKRLFNNDKYEDYMMFLRGMTYYVQIRNEERSGDFIDNSLIFFNQLVEKHPNSMFTNAVKEKILFLKKMQQFSDLSIAEFYQKTDNYISSIRLYTGMLKKYRNKIFPEIEEIVLCRIVEITKTLEMDDLKNEYEKMLKLKYPNKIC